MSKSIKGALLLLLAIFSLNTFAQNYYNSPYTRYHIGDLVNYGFATNRALGGSSIALRQTNQINYLNPASYTAQDTNSFLFQIGFTGRIVNIQTEEDSDQSNNGNIEYIAIGFPITKWLNLSAGLVPYSRIQYSFTEVSTPPNVGEPTTFDYTGFGGFNRFYLGAGLTIKEVLSLGLNLNYLFGSLDRTQSSYLNELEGYSALIESTENYIASDFYTNIGFQYHPTFNEKHNLIVGGFIDARSNINVKLQGQTIRYNTGSDRTLQDSLYFNIDTVAPLFLPNKIGFGISYNYDDVFTATAEYIRQDWTGTNIVASNFKTGIYESYRFGMEYNPVPLKRRTRESYYKRIKYRLGGYYTKSYLYYESMNIADRGITVGFGFPMKNARNMFTGTTFNITYQYGIRGTKKDNLIQENYHMITVGFTLHDFWFLKPKYD